MNKRTKKISLVTLVLLALIVVTVGFIFISNALSKKANASTYNESVSVEENNVVASNVKSLSKKSVTSASATKAIASFVIYLDEDIIAIVPHPAGSFPTINDGSVEDVSTEKFAKEHMTFLGLFAINKEGEEKRYYDQDLNIVDTNEYDFKTNNVQLKPKWEGDSIKIYLNHNGGISNTASIVLKYGDTLGHVDIPTKEGYSFNGYYVDGIKVFDENGDLDMNEFTYTSDITVIADWKIREYKIKYTVLNPEIGYWRPDDEDSDKYPMIYTVNDVIIFEKIIRGRYELKFNPEYLIYETGDKNINCEWILKSMKITYELSGGINNPDNRIYLVGNEGFTLKDPKKVGYEFTGWYLDGNKVTTIINYTGEDITLTAHWEPRLKYASGVSISASATKYTLPNTSTSVAVELPATGFNTVCLIDIPKDVTKVQFYSLTGGVEYYVCIRAINRTKNLDIYLDNVKLRVPLSTDMDSGFSKYCIYSPCKDVITNLYTYNDVYIYGQRGLDGTSTSHGGQDGGAAILCSNLILHCADNLNIMGGDGGFAYYDSNAKGGYGGTGILYYQTIDIRTTENVHIFGGYSGDYNSQGGTILRIPLP